MLIRCVRRNVVQPRLNMSLYLRHILSFHVHTAKVKESATLLEDIFSYSQSLQKNHGNLLYLKTGHCSLFLEKLSYSVGQEIACLLWKQRVHYYKSPPLDSIVSQLNAVHNLIL